MYKQANISLIMKTTSCDTIYHFIQYDGKIGFTGDGEIMLIQDALTLYHTTEVINTTVEIFSRTQPLLDFM